MATEQEIITAIAKTIYGGSQGSVEEFVAAALAHLNPPAPAPAEPTADIKEV